MALSEEEAARRAGLSAAQSLFEGRQRSFSFAHGLEHAVSRLCKAPRVLVILGGDLTTLKEILTYARVSE